MPTTQLSRSALPLVATPALLSSAVGAALLFDARAGINWPIFIAITSLSVLLARATLSRKIETPLAVLLGWATVLSFGWALRNNGFLHFLVFASDAMLLGLAVISIGCDSWSSLSAKLLAVVPFLAPYRVWRASAHEVATASGTASSPRSRSIITGVVLTLPVMVVLVILLGDADPVIRWATDQLTRFIPDWSFFPRLAFFALLFSVTLGANAIAARQGESRLPVMPRLNRKVTIGPIEQTIVLWGAAIVLWLFVLLQISYLIHPPPAAIGSGVTFAEYARRGFGELALAVTIVGAVILVLEFTRPSDATEEQRKKPRVLELALILALELILLSAFRRVVLYEQAYGFTTSRVFAQAYMLVVALSLIALGVEVRRRAISIAFGRRVAEIALAAVTILVFWNYEAWIVNQNIDRAASTGKFDVSYAARLSDDAIPALIARQTELPTPAPKLGTLVVCRPESRARSWYEWNRAAAAKGDALHSLHPESCPPNQILQWSRAAALKPPAAAIISTGG